MSVKPFLVAVSVATVLILGGVLVLYFGCPEIGSAYLMLTRLPENAAPAPTVEFSLPMLRVSPADPHDRPHTLFWVWIVWGCLLAGPPLVLAMTARATTLEQAVTRWVAGLSIYLSASILLLAFVAIGLALPFACL